MRDSSTRLFAKNIVTSYIIIYIYIYIDIYIYREREIEREKLASLNK